MIYDSTQTKLLRNAGLVVAESAKRVIFDELTAAEFISYAAAWLHYVFGDPATSAEFLLSIAESLRQRGVETETGMARILVELGKSKIRIHQVRRAKGAMWLHSAQLHFRSALHILQESDAGAEAIANNYLHLAAVWLWLEEPQEAIDSLRCASRFLEKAGALDHYYQIVRIYSRLETLLKTNGLRDEAFVIGSKIDRINQTANEHVTEIALLMRPG